MTTPPKPPYQPNPSIGAGLHGGINPGVGDKVAFTADQISFWLSHVDPSFVADYLQVPEIHNIAELAMSGNWSAKQFETAVAGSQFWQATISAGGPGLGSGGGGSGGGGGANPQTKLDDIESIKAELNDMAGKLGYAIGTDPMNKAIDWIATFGQAHGYSSTQYNDALTQMKDQLANRAGTSTVNVSADQIKQLAGQYMVPISDVSANEYATRIAKGELTIDGVQSVLTAQASARFSWMGDLIAQGVTPQNYFAPIRDTIANTLELDPASINLQDPKWSGMLEQSDKKTGLTRATTLTEAQQLARQRPEWATTANARSLASSWVTGLQQAFAR